jgi:hypothetical protein
MRCRAGYDSWAVLCGLAINLVFIRYKMTNDIHYWGPTTVVLTMQLAHLLALHRWVHPLRTLPHGPSLAPSLSCPGASQPSPAPARVHPRLPSCL